MGFVAYLRNVKSRQGFRAEGLGFRISLSHRLRVFSLLLSKDKARIAG